MAPNLCPHKANPLACPQCYQMNLRKKAAQPPPQRVSLDPQITKGKVVNAATDLVAQQLAARKAQAMQNVDAKIAGKPQLAAAQSAPMPPPPMPQQPQTNPHTMPRHMRQQSQAEVQVEDGEPGMLIDDAEIAELERMFPKRESIIDRQSTHPEGVVRGSGTIAPGSESGGRASSRSTRPVITKGRRPA